MNPSSSAKVGKKAIMYSSSSSSSQGIKEIFQHLRQTKQIFLLDGGTGEELFLQGVPDDRKIWSATAVVHSQYHDILEQVHVSFLKSGANAITTNSYGIVPGVGFTDRKELSKYVTLAGQIARKSVQTFVEQQQQQKDEENESNNNMAETRPYPLVLGSMGPLIESYRPDKILPHNEGVDYYKIIARALVRSVDCFLGETLSCLQEADQIMEAIASTTSPPSTSDNNATMTTTKKPLMISFTLNSNGHLRSGESIIDVLPALLQLAQKHQVELLAVLLNCCEPESIDKALQQIQQQQQGMQESTTSTALPHLLLGAYANRLTAIAEDWSLEESTEPQAMREHDMNPKQYYHNFISHWIHENAANNNNNNNMQPIQMIGGCCGITPQHISYIHSQLQDQNRHLHYIGKDDNNDSMRQ